MSDFLGRHKRFLVTHLIGVLAFIVLWFIVGAIFGADTDKLQRDIQRSNADIANALPPGVKLNDIRRAREEQDAAVRNAAAALHRNPGRFTLVGAREADLHYNAMIDHLLGPERLERFALADIAFDESLGRPDKYPTTTSEIEWALRGLDVVDQMMGWILDVEATEFSGGIARVEKVECATAPKRSSRRTTEDEITFEHPVTFVIVGHPIGVSALIARLARPPEKGRFLELKDARIESLDEPVGQLAPRAGQRRADPRDAGRVRLRLVVSSLDVRADVLARGGTAP